MDSLGMATTTIAFDVDVQLSSTPLPYFGYHAEYLPHPIRVLNSVRRVAGPRIYTDKDDVCLGFIVPREKQLKAQVARQLLVFPERLIGEEVAFLTYIVTGNRYSPLDGFEMSADEFMQWCTGKMAVSKNIETLFRVILCRKLEQIYSELSGGVAEILELQLRPRQKQSHPLIIATYRETSGSPKDPRWQVIIEIDQDKSVSPDDQTPDRNLWTASEVITEGDGLQLHTTKTETSPIPHAMAPSVELSTAKKPSRVRKKTATLAKKTRKTAP